VLINLIDLIFLSLPFDEYIIKLIPLSFILNFIPATTHAPANLISYQPSSLNRSSADQFD
jgi:hypothetical protein